ncbi:hypothetical protein Hanom_Chr05g00447901 [Helianthus anomalus]
MIQILPVNIKGLAGSIATLANWFICWIVTLTAPLLLSWNDGGLSVRKRVDLVVLRFSVIAS